MADRAAVPGTSKPDDSPLTYWHRLALGYLELLRQVRDSGQDVRGTALMQRIRNATRDVPPK